MGKQGGVTGHIGSVPTYLCSFPVLKVTAPPVLLTLAYGYTHPTSWFHVTQSAMGSSDQVIR